MQIDYSKLPEVHKAVAAASHARSRLEHASAFARLEPCPLWDDPVALQPYYAFLSQLRAILEESIPPESSLQCPFDLWPPSPSNGRTESGILLVLDPSDGMIRQLCTPMGRIHLCQTGSYTDLLSMSRKFVRVVESTFGLAQIYPEWLFMFDLTPTLGGIVVAREMLGIGGVMKVAPMTPLSKHTCELGAFYEILGPVPRSNNIVFGGEVASFDICYERARVAERSLSMCEKFRWLRRSARVASTRPSALDRRKRKHGDE